MTDPLRRLATAWIVVFGVNSVAAHAHSIDLFAHAVGDEIHGTVEFGDGSPVVDLPVEISWDAPDATHEKNENAATVNTDANGKFIFKPTERSEHLFTCRTPDGHRAAYSLVFGRVAEIDAAGTIDDQIDASVQRHIGALQEQIHEYERQTRLRDVLGGIGYILGLAGVVALIKTRRRTT